MNWKETPSQYVDKRGYKPIDECYRLDVSIQEPDKYGISDITGNLTNTNSLYWGEKSSSFSYYGITFYNQSFFVLFGTFANGDKVDPGWARSFFRNRSIQTNNHNYFNHQKEIYSFLTGYPEAHLAFRLVTISFIVKRSDQNISEKSFLLPNTIQGVVYEGQNLRHEIQGTEINFDNFLSELRIYGVLNGLCIIFLHFGWSSLKTELTSVSNLHSISYCSLLITYGFDLSFANILTKRYNLRNFPSLLFYFLFTIQIIYYIILQFPIFIVILKEHMSNPIFVILDVFIFFTSFFFSPFNWKSNSYFFVIFSLSQWLPQIIKNVIVGQRNNITFKFLIPISIERFIIIYYFYIYSNNIFSTTSVPLGIVAFIYLLLQFLLLFGQSVLGPSFFLPTVLRKQPYNYWRCPPESQATCCICLSQLDESDQDVVVTPCEHAFHYNCLNTWIKEKDVCPICQKEIPPIEPKPKK